MKSTYKLLGVEWDHHPLPRYLPRFVRDSDRTIEHYSVERNLFDLEKYERRIDVSNVFSVDSLLPYNIIKKVKKCDCVYVRIDYEPTVAAIDMIDFYYLRVLQVIAFFENNLEDVEIVVIASNQAQEHCCRKFEKALEKADVLHN